MIFFQKVSEKRTFNFTRPKLNIDPLGLNILPMTISDIWNGEDFKFSSRSYYLHVTKHCIYANSRS